MTKYDDPLLTDEEREALNADESESDALDDQGGEDTAEAAAGQDDDASNADDAAEGDDEPGANDDGSQAQGDADEGAEGAAAEGEDGGEAEGDDEPGAADEDGGQGDDAQEQQQPPATPPQVDIEAAQQVIDAAKDKRAELKQKFTDGDIDDDEYADQLDQLGEDVAEARAAKAEYDRYAQAEEARWTSAVSTYLEQYPELKASQDVMQRYDAFVRHVTADPDYAHLSYSQQLEHAHAQLAVKAQALGIEGIPDVRVKAKKPANKQPPKQKTPAKPKPKGNDELGGAPRTLAKAPASEITGGSDDKYAAIRHIEENGSGDEFDEALAKLTPEQRDEYSSMA